MNKRSNFHPNYVYSLELMYAEEVKEGEVVTGYARKVIGISLTATA